MLPERCFGMLTALCGTQVGKSVEMENFFSRLTLDIIGKAVFNYDFDSLTHDDPVIQVCPPELYVNIFIGAWCQVVRLSWNVDSKNDDLGRVASVPRQAATLSISDA